MGLFSRPLLTPWTELDAARQQALSCTRCELHKTRTNVVFGSGKADRPDMMLIGEAPGQMEDETGLPFVGRAGKLLDNMLESIGYSRQDVYIANIVCCRPPENRKPEPQEIAQCIAYLVRQIRVVDPVVMVLLGRTAVENVLGKNPSTLDSVRGEWFIWDKTPVRVTYHPAFLLRNTADKSKAQEDLKAVRAKINSIKANDQAK